MFKEYIKQNFIMVVLRKAISHLVDIYRMTKKKSINDVMHKT